MIFSIVNKKRFQLLRNPSQLVTDHRRQLLLDYHHITLLHSLGILSLNYHQHEDNIFQVRPVSPWLLLYRFVGQNQTDYHLDHFLLEDVFDPVQTLHQISFLEFKIDPVMVTHIGFTVVVFHCLLKHVKDLQPIECHLTILLYLHQIL